MFCSFSANIAFFKPQADRLGKQLFAETQHIVLSGLMKRRPRLTFKVELSFIWTLAANLCSHRFFSGWENISKRLSFEQMSTNNFSPRLPRIDTDVFIFLGLCVGAEQYTNATQLQVVDSMNVAERQRCKQVSSTEQWPTVSSEP